MNKIIDEKSGNLDDLVVRARKDPFVQKIVSGEKEHWLPLYWRNSFNEPITSIAWSPDDSHIAVAHDKISISRVCDGATQSNLTFDAHKIIFTKFEGDKGEVRLYYSRGDKLHNVTLSKDYRTMTSLNDSFNVPGVRISSLAANSHNLGVCSELLDAFVYFPTFQNGKLETHYEKNSFKLPGANAIQSYQKGWAILHDSRKVSFYDHGLTYSHTFEPNRTINDFSLSDSRNAYLATDSLLITYEPDGNSFFDNDSDLVALSNSGNMIAFAKDKNFAIHNIEAR